MALSADDDKRLSQLMQHAQSGDKASYNKLLEEVCGMVRGFIERRLGRNSDSEDVLQEILISLHNARHTYNVNKPFAPWIFAIARHRICDHWRKAIRRLDSEELETGKIDVAEPEALSLDGPIADKLAQSLRRLPEQQRRVIDLIKLKGLSIREAARELKISEAALKVTAHRAYKALRKEFEVETTADIEFN